MAVTAHDVQIFVWKMIKLSSKTCFNVSIKHPYITSCSLFLFILYMCCPLFFWILIYSLPFAACAWVARKISSIRRARDCRREKEKEKERDDGSKKTKFTPPDAEDRFKDRRRKSYSRVHSVRRRKAKEIAMEEARSNAFSNGNFAADEDEEEERNAISSYMDSNGDTVEKRALVEESPKEIHEVEVDNSINIEFFQDPDLMKSLKLLREDEDTRDEANKAMDVGISDAERTKRLESLIARRKSRKVLNLQVRRSLMNTDAPPVSQMAPMVIPKINTWCSPSKPGGGPFSPVPGSAPSVMMPMRNPFDLPYDPQEEKPDLTGDSFQQEFAQGHSRDMMFCRHESFSLGPSLPLGFFDDRDDLSSVDDFGFRRRRPIVGYQFSKPENEESDTDFGLTTDAESGHEHESESNIDSHDDDDDDNDDDDDDDHIKEVIQVHENVAENHRGGGVPTKPKAQDELSLSSSSSSINSSEDERPVRIINREAILKSLSMRRNSVDIDTNENLQENNLTYANSALENASRLKQEYFAHKPQKRHGMTFSIASDMQVEVSEISSPPLTIDENMSYRDDASTFDGEMDRNTSWDGLDSWAGSSRLSEVSDNDTRLSRANEAGSSRSRRPGTAPLSEKHSIHPSSSAGEFSDNGESQTTNSLPDQNATLESNEVVENNVNVEPVQRVECEGETSTNPAAIDSNDPPPPPEERSLMQDAAGDRVHQTTISPKSVLQPTLSVASFEPDADDEAQLSGAHSVPQNSTPLVQFTVATSSSGDAQASQEASRPPSNASTSGAKDTKSSASDGKQKILENIEKPNEEAGDSSSSQMLGIQEPPAQTVDEKLKMQENSKDANPTNLSKNEMGNPTQHEHEHDASKPEDLERKTNSTTSNDPDDKKDEVKDLKHAE